LVIGFQIKKFIEEIPKTGIKITRIKCDIPTANTSWKVVIEDVRRKPNLCFII
jgi:hypothetical protein